MGKQKESDVQGRRSGSGDTSKIKNATPDKTTTPKSMPLDEARSGSPDTEKTMRISFKKFLGLMSIGVVFVATFVALGGDKAVRDIIRYYSSKPPVRSAVKMEEPKPEEIKMDWRLSPLSGAPFLTDEDIKYTHGVGKPYLVIVGHVFDITKGFKSYEPGSGYHGFIGQDGSRAFVTGKFDKEGLVSDLTGLSSSDFAGLGTWLDFYIKTYPFVGYHYGRFFDKGRKATSAFEEFLRMQDVAEQEKQAKESVQKEWPPCNVEWSDKAGTNVWCSVKSGGIDRDWIGFPVLFKESPDKEPRCACARESQLKDRRIHFYEGCDHKTHRCNGISK